MPPKKAQPTSSKKTEQKKKEKIIEDKTFGLKNKKGAKQQKFITQVEKQVKSGGQHPVAGANANVKKLEKERKQLEQKELAMLFKPVQTQKIEKGTDPKSVVCVFFKQGQCTKGDKCKFSHDLTVERKVEKRSLYVDMRDDMEGEETMENWNEEKLKEVVDKKHGKEKRMPTTDIICKYFLDAVEKYKYGWFWECPNGEKCIYRHALPAGYVLKRDKKILDQKKPDISLVDLIESERAALGPKQTKVTLESFIAWKKRKLEEKKEKIRKEEEKKRNEFKSGKNIGLSGREMFRPEEPSGQDEEEEEEEDESSTEGAGAVDAAPINENLFLSEDLEAGYVLKRDKKILDQKKPDISLVDLIESERAALGPKQTKVTLESFIAWKKRKLEEKKEKIRKEEEKKRNEFKSGKNIGLSGREMFSFNPDLVNDGQMEDGDEAFDSYQREEEEEETGIEYHEIDFNSIELGEVDGTGTVASADRFHRPEEPSGQDEEEEEEDESSTEGAGAVDAAPINENLFLSEDLEGLDDELNELDIDK
uniref:Zinc finger CCCH domain-containing protein 15 n=1 Tax=Lutzomyia longipalpis TaxID=7200 RepID=A0A1B0CHR7_LUTLO